MSLIYRYAVPTYSAYASRMELDGRANYWRPLGTSFCLYRLRLRAVETAPTAVRRAGGRVAATTPSPSNAGRRSAIIAVLPVISPVIPVARGT